MIMHFSSACLGCIFLFVHSVTSFSTVPPSLLSVFSLQCAYRCVFPIPRRYNHHHHHHHHRHRSQVYGTTDDNSEADRVRKQLESLLGDSNGITAKEIDVGALMDPIRHADNIEALLPKQPPLTAAERDRRLAEIHLLEKLLDSDAALKELWDLWFSERGVRAKQALEKVDQHLAAGNVIVAEKMLKQMIQTYGVYWVEPINRLATLLYMDGRLEESHKLCLVVLHLRPYHFGALSGIVAVSIGLGKREQARMWADKRLPSLVASTSFPPFAKNGPTNPRRAEWVKRAVQQAQEALSHLEFQTQKDFGKPEDYYKKKRAATKLPTQDEPTAKSPQLFEGEEEQNAWQ